MEDKVKISAVYARVCGYYRPVNNWNAGKKQEWKDRNLTNVTKHKS